jgi:hypothetical protein
MPQVRLILFEEETTLFALLGIENRILGLVQRVV